MPTDGPQGIPAPLLTDPPDGPSQLAAAHASIAGKLNATYASAAARDADLPNPTDGQECYVGTGAGAVKMIFWDGGWYPTGGAPRAQITCTGQGTTVFTTKEYRNLGSMSASSPTGYGAFSYSETAAENSIIAGAAGFYLGTAWIRPSVPVDTLYLAATRSATIEANWVTSRSAKTDETASITHTMYLDSGESFGFQVYLYDSFTQRGGVWTGVQWTFLGA